VQLDLSADELALGWSRTPSPARAGASHFAIGPSSFS
jgi:hypothetical protein